MPEESGTRVEEDTALHVTNYRYRTPDLDIICHTCVPRTDQRALDYIEDIQRQYQEEVGYLERRQPGRESLWEPILWDEADAGTFASDEDLEWKPFEPRLPRTLAQG